MSRKRLQAELMSAGEVAAYLDVQPNTVRAWHTRGQMVEPLVVLGCGPLWLREDVERWNHARPQVGRRRAAGTLP